MTDTKPAPVLTPADAEYLHAHGMFAEEVRFPLNRARLAHIWDAIDAIASGAVECRPVEQPPAPPARDALRAPTTEEWCRLKDAWSAFGRDADHSEGKS